MTSRGAVAAKVAQAKAAHPEQFCPEPRCLWRTGGGRCPRHGGCTCDPKRPLPLVHADGCPKAVL